MADDSHFASAQSPKARVQPLFSHECLRSNPFFRGRDPAFLRRVIDEVTVEVFCAGEIIVKEGDTGDSMYFLHRGTAEVLIGAQEDKVAELTDGDIFGEMALMGVSNKRMSTVRAKDFCDCRVMHQRPFMAILKRFPAEQAFFKSMVAARGSKLKEVNPGKSFHRRVSRRMTCLMALSKRHSVSGASHEQERSKAARLRLASNVALSTVRERDQGEESDTPAPLTPKRLNAIEEAEEVARKISLLGQIKEDIDVVTHDESFESGTEFSTECSPFTSEALSVDTLHTGRRRTSIFTPHGRRRTSVLSASSQGESDYTIGLNADSQSRRSSKYIGARGASRSDSASSCAAGSVGDLSSALAATLQGTARTEQLERLMELAGEVAKHQSTENNLYEECDEDNERDSDGISSCNPDPEAENGRTLSRLLANWKRDPELDGLLHVFNSLYVRHQDDRQMEWQLPKPNEHGINSRYNSVPWKPRKVQVRYRTKALMLEPLSTQTTPQLPPPLVRPLGADLGHRGNVCLDNEALELPRTAPAALQTSSSLHSNRCLAMYSRGQVPPLSVTLDARIPQQRVRTAGCVESMINGTDWQSQLHLPRSARRVQRTARQRHRQNWDFFPACTSPRLHDEASAEPAGFIGTLGVGARCSVTQSGSRKPLALPPPPVETTSEWLLGPQDSHESKLENSSIESCAPPRLSVIEGVAQGRLCQNS